MQEVLSSKNKKIFLFSILLTAFYLSQHATGWLLLKLGSMHAEKTFIDLRLVLHSADCAREIGWKIFSKYSTQECSYIYGSNLIRFLNLLRINESQTDFIGILSILVLCIIFAWFIAEIQNPSRIQIIMILLLFVSPPVELLLERGNFDLIVLFLFLIVANLIKRNHEKFAAYFLFLAATFKFYPIIVFPILLGARRRLSNILFFSICLSAASYFLFSDLRMNDLGFPRPADSAFGLPIFGIYLHQIGIFLNSKEETLVGVLILIISMAIIHFLNSKYELKLNNLRINEYSNTVGNKFSQVCLYAFLGCYMASTNYDYRIVFLIFPLLNLIIFKSQNKYERRAFWALALGISWSSYNIGILQPIGDVLLNFLVAGILMSVLYNLNNYLHSHKRRGSENSLP